MLCASVLVSAGVFALLHRTAYAQTDSASVLACPYALEDADPVAHSHSETCLDDSGALICTLPEIDAHTHTDACYDAFPVLTCDLEESDGHVHTDSCYQETETLACGLEESEGHSHTDACWLPELGDLICGITDDDHTHSESCYLLNMVLVCGLEEGEGAHRHGEACYATDRVLCCGLEEGAGAHQHTDACYTVELLPVCGMEECSVHTHTEDCFRSTAEDEDEATRKPEEAEDEKEPARPEKPESNPYADLETAAVWEKSFADVLLTGNWAEDVLAIARTQLGYTESSENFDCFLNDAGDDYVTLGWTRYGAWYGYPYGDWCAMFVSFCLHYAGITEKDFPYDCGTVPWVEKLRALERFSVVEEYTPRPGDLIFFDRERDQCADHVGLVCEVDEEENLLRTVEGNHTRSVDYFEYFLDDRTIMGYGILPENPLSIVTELRAASAAKSASAGTAVGEAADDAAADDATDPELLSVPDAAKMPAFPKAPESMKASETPDAPESTKAAAPSNTLNLPNTSPASSASLASKAPQALDAAETFENPEVAETPAESAETVERMPPQEFKHAAGGIAVCAAAPVGAFPEGSWMYVTPVNGNLIRSVVSPVVSGEVLEVQAVDIKFYDSLNRRIQPCLPIRVAITPAASQYEGQGTCVVHIDDAGSAGQNPLLGDVTAQCRDLAFEADCSAIYAVVYVSDRRPISPLTQDLGTVTTPLRAAGDDGFTEGPLTVTKEWQNRDGQPLPAPPVDSVSFNLYSYTMTDVAAHTNDVNVSFISDGGTTTFDTLHVPDGDGIVVSWTYRNTPDYVKNITINGVKYTRVAEAAYAWSGLDASLTIVPAIGDIVIEVQDSVAPQSRSVSLYSAAGGTTVYSKSSLVEEGVVLNDRNNWTHTWTVSDTAQGENVLPHTGDDGATCFYYVEEDAVDGFDTSYNPDGQMPADRARQSGEITIVNKSQKQLVDVLVTKRFSGVDSLPATFRITATLKSVNAETNETSLLGTRTLALPGAAGDVLLPQTGADGAPQYTWTIPNLKAGTLVELEEQNFDITGYSMVTAVSSNDSNTFSAQGRTASVRARSTAGGIDPAQVDFVNTYTLLPGSLSLSKQVTGADAETDRDFVFRLVLMPPEGTAGFSTANFPAQHIDSSGSSNAQTFIGTGTTGGGKMADITLKHNETYIVSNLPAGTRFSITEEDCSALRYSMSVSAGFTLVDQTFRGTVPGGANPDVAVTVTNTRAPAADLQLVKRDSANGELLPGAEFSLRAISPDDPHLATLEGSEERTATTSGDGTATFAELIDGYYELREIQAPEGYILHGDMVACFRVVSGVLSMLTPTDGTAPAAWTAGATASGDLISFAPATGEGDSATPATVTVRNTAGTPIPATGGSGTRTYTLVGCLVLLVGAVGLICRKKHDE